MMIYRNKNASNRFLHHNESHMDELNDMQNVFHDHHHSHHPHNNSDNATMIKYDERSYVNGINNGIMPNERKYNHPGMNIYPIDCYYCDSNRKVNSTNIRTIRLRANHFDITISKKLRVHHYLIRISSLTDKKGIYSKRFLKEIIQFAIESNFGFDTQNHFIKEKNHNFIVTDGKSNIYSLDAFPMLLKDTLEFSIDFSGKLVNLKDYNKMKSTDDKSLIKHFVNNKFTLILEYLGMIDFNEQIDEICETKLEHILTRRYRALDAILRHLSAQKYTSIGHSFYNSQISLEMVNPSKTKPNNGLNKINATIMSTKSVKNLPKNMINYSELSLGFGREVWFGYHQSLKVNGWKPKLNIDISATAFYKSQNVIDFMREILGDRETSFYLNGKTSLLEIDRLKLLKEIKGLKVEVNHNGNYKRKYKVNNLTKLSAHNLSFSFKTPNRPSIQISVQKYFFHRYGIVLKYPQLECLQVGLESKQTFLPLEVCTIVKGQRCMKKLNDKQTSNMIKVTAKSALEREKEINALMSKVHLENSEFYKNFGIDVSKNMTEFIGRVLDPPQLQYGSDGTKSSIKHFQVMPHHGTWDMRGKRFLFPVTIRHWAIVSLCSTKYVKGDMIDEFVTQLINIGHETGMKISHKPIIYFSHESSPSCTPSSKSLPSLSSYEVKNSHNDTSSDGISPTITRKSLKDTMKCLLRMNSDLQLICIIISGRSQTYGEIKRLGDKSFMIPTQCIQAKTLTKFSSQTLSNLCLKINAKLGGINSTIVPMERNKIFREPVIFFGADVTHPPSSIGSSSINGDKSKLTIVGVVASIDAHPFSYASALRVQSKKHEFIVDLKNIVIELLCEFYHATKFKPVRIIFYRCGVAQSQFEEVLCHELNSLRDACRYLEDSYEPGITYLMIQKRHHTRLFCSDPSDSVGKSCNVPAGTLVDSPQIVKCPNREFFLCSHTGIQGTSRPSHYHIMWDDNDLSSEDLQIITYHLCYTYIRCTRSVSVPAPAYYAHLVAFRGRFYIIESLDAALDGLGEINKRQIIEEESRQKSVLGHSEEINLDKLNREIKKYFTHKFSPSMYFA